MSNPTCFISYSWDSDEHRAWVRKLATALQNAGVETRLDQWDVRPGADLLRYLETSVRESDFVLLICTPTFAAKANLGKGGVGYEKAIVSAEVFENAQTEKFIPILRSGSATEALPSYIKSRVFLDFSNDGSFESALEDLLRVLHGKPLFSRPPLGPIPALKDSATLRTLRRQSPEISIAEFKTIFDFAWDSGGLNLLSRQEAQSWAEQWVKSGRSVKDLHLFKQVFQFAYGSDGINLPSRSQALEWAEMWLRDHRDHDLEQFKEAFRFAYGSSGLNLSASEAATWALRKLSESDAV